MTENETIAIIAVSGVVFSAACVLAASIFAVITNNRRLDDVRTSITSLTSEFSAFKDVVNGKFSALDSEIGKILDKLPK